MFSPAKFNFNRILHVCACDTALYPRRWVRSVVVHIIFFFILPESMLTINL